jgi:site-specific DNA-methyltransferase (adenine-specific)
MDSKNGTLVYDPFIGIGTTALACISLGVNYLGTEIDPEFIKVANENILGRMNKARTNQKNVGEKE